MTEKPPSTAAGRDVELGTAAAAATAVAPAEGVPEGLLTALAAARTRGNALFQEGRLPEAVAAYERSLAELEGLAPSTVAGDGAARRAAVALYCNAAHIFLKAADAGSARLEQAGDAAGKALALDPSNVKALFRRGCARSLAERWRPAAEDFEQVLRLEPGNEAAQRELQLTRGKLEVPFAADVTEAEACKAEGTRLFQEGRHFEAYAAWKQGLDVLDGIPTEFLADRVRKLAVALCNNGAQALLRCPGVEGATTERARVMAQRALALDPSSAKALFRRGCAYFNSEKWDLARTDFEEVLRLEPGSEAAQRELARLEDAEAAAAAASGTDRGLDGGAGSGDSTAAVETGAAAAAEAAKRALREADRFRRQVLALADEHGCVEKWCQRFSKLQVQACQWAKHQLADADMLTDLVEVWGPVFNSMDKQQREDFLSSYEFIADMKAQFGEDIRQLQLTEAPPDGAAAAAPPEEVAASAAGSAGPVGDAGTEVAAEAEHVAAAEAGGGCGTGTSTEVKETPDGRLAV